MAQKKKARRRLVIGLGLVLVALLVLSGVVVAETGITAVLHSWDDGKARWENGNITMYLNDIWQPFYQNFEWSTDVVPNACDLTFPGVVGTDTMWAGEIFLDHDHIDNTAGGIGFQQTNAWKVVKCSAFDDRTNKEPDAADILVDCIENGISTQWGLCDIVAKDVPESPCHQGNCQTEIVTTVRINLDQQCDGVLDLAVDPDNICFYWMAEKPPFPTAWTLPLNSSIWAASGGQAGEKTVTFKLFGPNAITLAGLSASSSMALPAVVAVVALGALVVGGVALVYRRRAK
jgi:hypothetical protein